MTEWSDDEPSASGSAPQSNSNEESNFSRGRGRGGRGRGRGSSFSDRNNHEDNFSGDVNNENREFGERRGRGRGRGRGFSFGDRGDRENENPEGNENRGFENRRGRGGYNRDNNGNSEEGSGNRGFGNRRGRGGFNRENREDSDRPNQQNDENQGEENKEEKKREIYVPEEPTDAETLFGSAISAGINFDNFDKIEVQVTGKDSEKIKPINTFEEGNLREFLIENIKKSGYTKPTPIQKHSIPIIMSKRGLMGCAQTGSGKTASFVIPILNVLMTENDTLNPGKPQCLIIAPTRELAIQIRDETMKFASGSFIKVCLAYGGAATRYQTENITQGCHILVATPGRLSDFVNKSIVTFDDLKFLVLDEADRMLDMGFREVIETICNHDTMNKDNLTTLMFSATFPDAIQHLAAKYLRDYLFLTIGIVGGASTDVEQEFIEVERKGKRQLLTDILKTYTECADEDRILVFVETKKTADYLASLLSEMCMSSTSLHGDRTQRERETALREFRQGVRKVLIATAVAARGLDIKGVTHVINYDLPKEVDEYIHRIGRTGRVGNRGKATSFFDKEKDDAIVSELTRMLKQANQVVPGFFNGCSGACGETDQFGGSDIRQPAAAAGAGQEEEGEW
ncbi:ATP-dependent RNA helicase vasa-like [Chironomus tepperi]|uniref:ATP-dependent RNA helicase vasa-like n=1 Tax=Chironomus tepperi TaxID=113505 RepID=UPI00391F1062